MLATIRNLSTGRLASSSAGIEGTYTAYIAQYDTNGKLVAINSEPVNFTDGEKIFGSNISVLSNAVTVKLLLWDESLKPVADVQEVTFMNANNDPFKGDDHVNVVFLGRFHYSGNRFFKFKGNLLCSADWKMV